MLLELGRAHRRSTRELAAKTDDLRRNADQLQRAHRRVGEAVASTSDRGALERVLLTMSVEAVRADHGRLSARTPEGALVQRLVVGDPEPCSGALAAAESALLAHGGPQLATAGEATALAIPLGDPSPGDRRRRAGAVTVARIGAAFSPSERDLLEHLAAQAAISLENIDLHELVQRQAITDELTGLLNHRRLQQVLGHALADTERAAQPVALLMLDIDDFKGVNDTYGHRQGDRVLKEVADVLLAASRPGDHAGRYGGEEMALVLPGATLEEAHGVAERVREAIAAIRIPGPQGKVVAVTASLGVAAAPACAGDRASLIEAADRAMYAAKRTGKDRTVQAPRGRTSRFARTG